MNEASRHVAHAGTIPGRISCVNGHSTRAVPEGYLPPVIGRTSYSVILFSLLTLPGACRSPGGTELNGDPDLAKLRAAGDLPSLDHERYHLENGLEVILHQDRRLPLAAVSVWYHVGAIDERPGRSGFAHLFEHMMFQGSPHVGPDMHFKILERIGGTQMNGTTNFDRTNYFETVPAHELETALWLEADRMGFLLASLSEESLENQIDVVQNERRQAVESRPYGLMSERITQELYPKPHPYHGDVIGSLEDIAAATLDDVREFFRNHYTPANATLTLAGDFEIDEAKALVKRYFGSLSGRPRPPRAQIPAPRLAGTKRIAFEEPVARLPKVSVAWMAPSAFEADTAALDLLAHVISGTRSSRLDKRVSFDDLIAQSVTAFLSENRSGSTFQIDLVVRPGRTLEEAQAAIDEVLADLRARPPTQEELDRALNSWETGLIRGLQQLGGFGGRAERLELYNHYLGDPGKLAWDIERFRAVTKEDLARAIEKHLGGARLIVHAAPISAKKSEATP